MIWCNKKKTLSLQNYIYFLLRNLFIYKMETMNSLKLILKNNTT